MENLQDLKKLTAHLNVLYVEDDEVLRLKTSLLLKKLFANVIEAKDGQEGFELYKSEKFDLVLTDIEMPNMNGLEMSEKIRELDKDQIILIVSAYSDTNHFTKSIKIGIDGFLLKPIDGIQMYETFYKVARKLATLKENEEYKNNLELLVKAKTTETIELYDEKTKNYEAVLIGLVSILEARDPYTGGHSQRVAYYSKMIAKEMGYPKEEYDEIFYAAILHDIGKIAIPDSVLLKPGRLNELEFNMIKEHPAIGADLLKNMKIFEHNAKVIRHHHECYDGKGYPDGLKGDQIPVFSQIMSIADTFDAMTTSRIYKNSKSIKEALDELTSLKNIKYKDNIVDSALKVLSKVKLTNYVDQLPKNDFERERFSYFYRDHLTNSFNEDYLDLMLKSNFTNKTYNFLQLIELKNFNSYNKSFGWNQGNELLKKLSNTLQESVQKNMLVFRVNGDDFIIISKKQNNINLDAFSSTLEETGISIQTNSYDIHKSQAYSFKSLESILQ